MQRLKELLDHTNPLSIRFGDYCMLHQLAYDYEPAPAQQDRFLNQTEAEQLVSLRLLASAASDTVMLTLECLGLDMPTWMTDAAPDALTHQRWIESGWLGN